MTSLLIALWVWPTVLAAQATPKDFPPEERAMRKHCAGVDEKLIQRVHDYALKTAAGGGSDGAAITQMRQWVKDEKLADQVSDACLVEIVRLARARNVKEQKTKQDAAAKVANDRREAEQLTTWNAFTETEKRWVILAERERVILRSLAEMERNAWNVWNSGSSRDKGAPEVMEVMNDFSKEMTKLREFLQGDNPIIHCGLRNMQVGDMGFIRQPVVVTNITSSTSVICELKCITALNDMAKKVGPDSIGVWISGVDTSKLTTGSEWLLGSRPFEVVGTKTYSTAVGSNRTVFDLQLLPINPDKLNYTSIPPGVTIDNFKEAVKSTYPTTLSP